MSMFIAFGITFEVPVAVILLVKAGIVVDRQAARVAPYVIVGAFVVAAIVTPPDVVSQFMLAVPMCLLFEAWHRARGMLSRPSLSREAAGEDGTAARRAGCCGWRGRAL